MPLKLKEQSAIDPDSCSWCVRVEFKFKLLWTRLLMGKHLCHSCCFVITAINVVIIFLISDVLPPQAALLISTVIIRTQSTACSLHWQQP